MTTLKIGLIGAGSIGGYHAKSIRAIDGVELSAIADIRLERAKALAESCGVDKVYRDYVEMLDQEPLDAVVVATPNHLHARMTIDALSNGVDVFCEKPMAMNSKEAEAMLNARDRYGRTLMLGMCQRFRGDSRAIREVVLGGELGDVYFTKVTLLRRAGIPGMGSWFTTRSLSGGGPLIDLGPHALDLALWFQGFPRPVAVKGYTFSKLGTQNKCLGTWGIPEPGGPFDVEDLALALIELEGGKVMYLELSWALYTLEDTFNCILSGDKAGVSLTPPLKFTESAGEWVETRIEHPEVEDVYLEEMKHFVECLREGRRPEPLPEQGLTVMKVIDAIYMSAGSGKEVSIG
jgi:predicted dehydrogenase